MRSPSDGFLGNIAKHLMINFNEFIINDSVKKLDVRNNDEVIEIGSGNGQAIEKILQLTNKKITSIEVSEKFRNQLIQKFSNQKVVFFSNDAKQLGDIIKDNTFTKLLAINVIYFLYPLERDVEGVEALFTPKLSQVEVLHRCATMSVDVT